LGHLFRHNLGRLSAIEPRRAVLADALERGCQFRLPENLARFVQVAV
jgi:hypothetical protein